MYNLSLIITERNVYNINPTQIKSIMDKGGTSFEYPRAIPKTVGRVDDKINIIPNQPLMFANLAIFII